MLNANQRDGRYVPKRLIERKEACAAATEQTSNATNAIEIQIYNNINLKVCQGGLADD